MHLLVKSGEVVLGYSTFPSAGKAIRMALTPRS